MSQIALPLTPLRDGPSRIVIGAGNGNIAGALQAPQDWPFHTAVLTGPARSGKTLFGRWFAESGAGDVIDDAHLMDETDIFHRWNRAQQDDTALLIIAGTPPWTIALPDLRSRLGAALQLETGQPDDAMAADLLQSMAQERGMALGADATDYLVPRAGRSQAELERLVVAIDRLSLERKAAPTQSVWRAALQTVHGPDEPRLI